MAAMAEPSAALLLVGSLLAGLLALKVGLLVGMAP